MIIGLAAPHTWSASIVPVLATGAFVYRNEGSLNIPLFLVLIIICALMQSAVNTVNDYSDAVSGADSEDDDVDASDAVLVYNNINPKKALALAIVFLLIAMLLGIYPIYNGGMPVLYVALIGILVVFMYSMGPVKISYLPIGEIMSGFVMGCLIPLGCYVSLTGRIYPMIMAYMAPVALSIGMIMLTNNTYDIDKDKEAGRKTLPVILGWKDSVKLYRILLFIWAALLIVYRIFVFPYLNNNMYTWIACFGFFCLGLVKLSEQYKKIANRYGRPMAMKNISLLTLLFGLSFVFIILS